MVFDLSAEMSELAASLGVLAGPLAPGQGRVIQFASARSHAGTSTVAREFARFAAARSRRPVWLIDLDLRGGGQYAYVKNHPMLFGEPGVAAAGSPDGSVFFTILPPSRDDMGRVIPDARYLVAHPVNNGMLWVSRFRGERLQRGQAVHVLGDEAYWTVMRKHADLVVIDAPSTDRSPDAITIAPNADATVMVVAGDDANTAPAAILKNALIQAGGEVAGVFVNRVLIEPPAFLRAVMP